jgi:hypothetical protein
MLAQSVVEYGAISGALASGREAAYSAQAWLADLSTETWMAVGGVLLALLLVWSRWRSRA